jgi:hypothetical protein
MKHPAAVMEEIVSVRHCFLQLKLPAEADNLLPRARDAAASSPLPKDAAAAFRCARLLERVSI